MPGICGIAGSPSRTAAVGIDAMLGVLRRFDWQSSDRLDLPGGSLGHVAVAPPGLPARPALATSGAIAIAFDGELYAPFTVPPGRSMAESVATGLAAEGRSLFDGHHGCFACALWDLPSGRISIATDRFGMRPIYWTHVGNRFLFASEPGALLALDEVSTEYDEEGLAQFLAFGQCLGTRTIYKSLTLVPAGTWVTFDAMANTVTERPYARPDELPAARTDAEWKELIDERVVAAVAQSCAGDGALGLSLSGGLDARTILGLAPADARLSCVSLGIPGSIDHRSAAALARIAGQPHRPIELDGDFLARFVPLLKEVIALTDGQYLDQGIVLTTLPTYRDLGIQTLLRGHAGELMHMSKAYAFSLDDRALALQSKEALADWLWEHLTAYMIGPADERLFVHGFGRRMRDAARGALERALNDWDAIEPVPQRIWRMFVAERLRRETALSLQLFRNFVEVRVPFLEPSFVAAVLAAPPHLKTHDELQTFMLGRHRPAFLDIVNANTGAPMGAGRLRIGLSHARLRVLSKLRVPGYQPYERLGLWLARDLQPLLREALLDPSSVPCELFDGRELARLIAEHADRSRNHTALLMGLLTLSLASETPRRPAAAPAVLAH